MNKVLVIGGAGYIGGLTVDFLTQEGYDVTIFDGLFYESRYLKPCKFIYGDIRNTSHLLEVAQDFDTIVYLAALVGDAACQVDLEHTENINHLAVKNFVNGLNPGKRLIFISTCSVYGAQDGILNEESPTSPLSAYASTKLKAESSIINYGGLIFRLGTVYGVGDPFSRIRLDLIVNVLTLRAIKNKKISIFGGEQWRPIISVYDVAKYITEACGSSHTGIYCLGQENVHLADLGRRVAGLIPGTTLELNDIPFQDFRNYRVDNSKSIRDFKHKPEKTVETEVTVLGKLLKENRILNPEAEVYHNGIFLKNNTEVLNVR
jgi:nucleoside-diphosphate-sugar epimerase